MVDKNCYLGVQVVQGCSWLPLEIMSFLFLELSEYVLGQHVSELFPPVADEVDKLSQAVHTSRGRIGFGQHSQHTTPSSHSRAYIEMRGKKILRHQIYPHSHIKNKVISKKKTL